MEYLKYTLWPLVKVRGLHLWWALKYGGKKHIPPELILGQMEKSLKRFSENMEQAFRTMPANLSDSEKREMIDLLCVAKELEEEMRRFDAERKGGI